MMPAASATIASAAGSDPEIISGNHYYEGPQLLVTGTADGDLATLLVEIDGEGTSVPVNAYGEFGGMAFISLASDMAAADEMAATVRADAGYLERITASAGLFVDGTAHQSLLRRLA